MCISAHRRLFFVKASYSLHINKDVVLLPPIMTPERIHFVLFGLHLQEPMALVMNWIIASICFFSYANLEAKPIKFNRYWRLFFLILGISTAIGGLSHLFFQYWGITGKFPVWVLGVAASLMSCLGMLEIEKHMSIRRKMIWQGVVFTKSISAIVLSFVFENFIFIAIDAAVGYIFFCMVYGIVLLKRGFDTRRMIWAVLILLPSLVFYIGKISLGKWMNEQDIGHLFMMASVYAFYLSVKHYSEKTSTVN